ncbi:Pentatricopeptide repeat (PPR) superfamily protein [Zea mays]|uniref:Pentatricopeptide repeat (PPR) superfamily protein n=1 Tax=Zea mays TaxID=4577 RepID=A0A1D6N4G0_MAIZE|nr:Pentatricopeptide repeat (PPR) superfamily protein [Zea mays]
MCPSSNLSSCRELGNHVTCSFTAQAIHNNNGEKMDSPSNGLSIVGYLRPAFIEEESYLRSMFHGDNGGYSSDWKVNETDEYNRETRPVSGTNRLIDDDKSRFDFNHAETRTDSMIYKLEIMTIELFSMYGKQFKIDPQDFQDSEPDILANSASSIIERIKENSDQCAAALRSLCRRKKGLTVEVCLLPLMSYFHGRNMQEASLIGVDSLGIDVRAFSGLEVKTVRFSFNAQALSERSAEKKIRRMLFPRYQRKNVKASTEDES